MKTSFREVASIRFYELTTRRSIWDNVRDLENSQWFEEAELIEYQTIKMRNLLIHAYNKVPYYRQSFDSAGFNPHKFTNLSQMDEIPILTKNALRNNLQDFIARDFDLKHGFYDSTGGSTGGPIQYYVGKISGGQRAARDVRFRKWYGFNIGQKKALLWGAQRDLSVKHNIFSIIKRKVFNTLELNAWHMTPDLMRRLITQIGQFSPRLIEAYSHALFVLANYAIDNNLEEHLDVPAVITAEMITSEQRKLIESVVSTVTDRYGSREFGAVAQECTEKDGMHISAESLFLESTSVNGVPNTLLITDLDSYSMPFIRYQCGDRGTISTGRCRCGRCLPRIMSFEGRVHDFVVTQDGRFINGTLFGMQLRHYSEVQEFQVVQHDLDRITVYLVLSGAISKENLDQISRDMTSFLGGSFKLDIVVVDNIPKSPSGKHRVVRSEV